MRAKLFATVLGVVCDVCCVTSDDLLSSTHRCDVVDARSILVYVLHKRGLYPTVIANLMNRSSVGVRKLINGFDNRRFSNKFLETMLVETENKLETKLFQEA